MKVIRNVAGMKAIRKTLAEPVGFVPTMGFLHAGHISLASQSKKDNASTIVSIFVNPTQFGPKEDFDKYPRDEQRDLAMLEKAGVDITFLPSAHEMYPSGFNAWVEVEGITTRLEGAVRPGHFKGVATVCNKLFNIVQPSKAYFGQKDAQQVLVIKKMVSDLNMNLEIVVMPTLREADGLAMSSRNSYLKPDERKAATVLYRALLKAKEMRRAGEHNAESLREAMTELIQAEPLAKIDYVSIADAATLQELEHLHSQTLVSLAVRVGEVRLIDNVLLP
ncbi:MAG: pantoate--beta-alanine ligase [Dehalococcoidia bacterium]|nr:MAG: pantoate--beta-alanine ligase [Dehalococcoidia bacterium]